MTTKAAPAHGTASPRHARSDPAFLGASAVLAMLAASAVCVAVAPALMPDSYSVVKNAVSESAAQGVTNAWLARLGLLLLGFAVLLLAQVAGGRWGAWGRVLQRVYGISAIAAAAFSHMPWEDVPYDRFEDTLHSVAASTMGAAFTVGVLMVTFRRGPGMAAVRLLDWTAIGAAVGISLLMFNVTTIAGLVQRIMFGIGYLWFAMESVGVARTGRRRPVAISTPRPMDEVVRA